MMSWYGDIRWLCAVWLMGVWERLEKGPVYERWPEVCYTEGG